MTETERRTSRLIKPFLRLITVLSPIIPRKFRARWKQEWQAELWYRSSRLAEWDTLSRRGKIDLLRRSTGMVWDAVWLQQKRLEEDFMQDLRIGIRLLIKRPAFTAVVVLTLALGIGANTAIFSVVNAILLRPLPFPDSDKLVLIWGDKKQEEWPQLPFSQPNFIDLRNQSHAFEGMAAWTMGKFNLTAGNVPQQIQYGLVSWNLFDVLKVKPALGRSFVQSEDRPETPRVAILSGRLWQRSFGSDPSIIGKPVKLDDKSYEVIGVMPDDFRFESFPEVTDAWIPFGLDPFEGRKYARGNNSLGVIARIKGGISLKQAQSELETISLNLRQQDPRVNAGWTARAVRLRDQAVADLSAGLWVLLGAVGFVLLIACANVSSLLLARANSRRREIAIRIALGASRLRLIRQLLTESLLLAITGGMGGVAAAWLAVRAMRAIPYNAPGLFIPYRVSENEIGIGAPVLLFTVGLSLLTGIVFGLAPAIQASSADLNASLKEGGASAGATLRQSRTRALLVVAEVALSMLLLAGAGLMMKSFLRLQNVDPGFQPENVLTLSINLAQQRYPEDERIIAFFQDLIGRLQTIPGVRSAGGTEVLPLSGLDADTGVFIEGRPLPGPNERTPAHYRSITPDYFQAMGMRLIQGRAFTKDDRYGSAKVTIVNENMARRYWPNENPIGKRVALNFEAMRFYRDRPPDFDIPGGMREIVGVVADVHHRGLDSTSAPEMYVPFAQRPVREMMLAVRTASDPGRFASAVRAEVSAVDKDQPIASLHTMTELMSASVAKPQFNLALMSLFAGSALILAGIGLYGVISYSVAQRTHEIGVRMALGARGVHVVSMILRQGLGLALVGIALGGVAALALTRVLESLLFSVSPTDPLVFTAIAILLACVSALASYIPARRATRVDPLAALRRE